MRHSARYSVLDRRVPNVLVHLRHPPLLQLRLLEPCASKRSLAQAIRPAGHISATRSDVMECLHGSSRSTRPCRTGCKYALIVKISQRLGCGILIFFAGSLNKRSARRSARWGERRPTATARFAETTKDDRAIFHSISRRDSQTGDRGPVAADCSIDGRHG